MSSKTALYRKRQKAEDPEAFANYLEKKRDDAKKKRAEEKKKWEEDHHTRAQIKEREAKLKAESDRVRAIYWRKKAEKVRQTRNNKPGPGPKTPERRKLKDMSPNERRAYNAKMRKKQRDGRSSQKKTADLMKQQRRRQVKKEEKMHQLASQQEPKIARLPKKAYNLNYEVP